MITYGGAAIFPASTDWRQLNFPPDEKKWLTPDQPPATQAGSRPGWADRHLIDLL